MSETTYDTILKCKKAEYKIVCTISFQLCCQISVENKFEMKYTRKFALAITEC